jgi:hypothetical protein
MQNDGHYLRLQVIRAAYRQLGPAKGQIQIAGWFEQCEDCEGFGSLFTPTCSVCGKPAGNLQSIPLACGHSHQVDLSKSCEQCWGDGIVFMAESEKQAESIRKVSGFGRP